MLAMEISTGLTGTAEVPFGQVMRQHEAQVLRTAYRMIANWADAEDIAQETFIRLHRQGVRFPSDSALASWLYRVTVNLCLDRIRGAKPVAALGDLPSHKPDAEARAIHEQDKDRLMHALDTLGPKERAAVVLREIEGLSTAEVAEVLGSTEATVRSQVSKAIVHLREIMK
jgi:RNA polymerase sigma-70 factor, ECF subfamily